MTTDPIPARLRTAILVAEQARIVGWLVERIAIVTDGMAHRLRLDVRSGLVRDMRAREVA